MKTYHLLVIKREVSILETHCVIKDERVGVSESFKWKSQLSLCTSVILGQLHIVS